MKNQKESQRDSDQDAGLTENSAAEFEPVRLTPWQNAVLTAKVLGAVALIIFVVWLLHRAKS
jgi:hypothetical protein